jgi:hypothetical protein
VATKVDFKRTLDSYKAKAGEFRLVELPTLQYLMVDGQGDPNTSPAYQQALQTLYPVAYKLKFASKRELGRDYVVPPLEGLWWADDMAAFTSRRNKHEWRWTMMLLVPEWLGADMVEAAREQAGAKNPPARLDDVRLQELTESLCVQTLHVGSFDDEGPVLERMHSEFLPVNGLQLTGKHHEVYLSDFRKVVAQKLRTILRQPVLRAR